jgi:hypothetical protein
MSSHGFIAMADITDYTVFLNESELEHAQDSLVAILEIVAGGTEAPLVINRVVGDAVISYGLDDQILTSQPLVDGLENIYVMYRRALEQMVLNTACGCNACANLSSLDLKLIVHHGELSIWEMAGNEELVGPQINLVFRLAKNRIKERLGIVAYIAYTAAAIDALGLSDFVTSLEPLVEDVDDFGLTEIHVADMHIAWERRRYEALVSIPDGDVMLSFTREVRAPLVRFGTISPIPAKEADSFCQNQVARRMARTARWDRVGAYVCAHGKYRVPHRIIDWIPLQ